MVNNNSSDSTANILKSFSSKYNNVSIIDEHQQGLSYARNTGYLNSKTEWVIYLDDDAQVPKDFIEKALEIIHSNKYDCFGGVYSPWYRYQKPKWFKDKYASTADYFESDSKQNLNYASGGIMAVKNSILIKYNGFPEKLGMTGNSLAYGEETFLQNQMKLDGHKIGIIPDWKMKHIVNKYKMKPSWFIKNGYVTGRDSWTIYSEDISLKRILKYIYYLFRDLIIDALGNTPKLFGKNYYWQNWIVETLQSVALQFGRIIGGLQQLSTRNKSEE